MLFTDFMKLADDFEDKANQIINVFEDADLISSSTTHYFNGFDSLNIEEGTVKINTRYYSTGCTDTDHFTIPITLLDGEFDEEKLEATKQYAAEQARIKKEAEEQRRMDETERKVLAEQKQHFAILDGLVANGTISEEQASIAKEKWNEDHEM